MLVCCSFHTADLTATRLLLDWIKLLDKQLNHDILLVADASVQWSDAKNLLDIARATFKTARLIATKESKKGWPRAGNFMFLASAKYIQENQRQPFLWLEGDCAPMRKGWLDEIECEYKTCGKPFMGTIVPCNQVGLPASYLNGVAVYPANAFELILPLIKEKAWDISMAEMAVPQSHNSRLFVHLWGQKDNPPTFHERPDLKHPEQKTVQSIPAPCALFHRCKDGTLLKLLKKKMFPPVGNEDDFVVIWPFFNGDSKMALKNLQWMIKLQMPRTHDILLSYEKGTDKKIIQDMMTAASHSFTNVYQTSYQMSNGWPQNIAFFHAARIMKQYGRAWFWMEFDAIPLVRNWLQIFQDRYDRIGKLFCGPVIKAMGHMNGTGIYPADTPNIIPITMQTNAPAWDVVMKKEMIHLTHDCSDIYCHRWGEDAENMYEHKGEAARFQTVEKVRKHIPNSAAIFHRSKYGDLIDRLTEINQEKGTTFYAQL